MHPRLHAMRMVMVAVMNMRLHQQKITCGNRLRQEKMPASLKSGFSIESITITDRIILERPDEQTSFLFNAQL
jgi:hypothetical protein